MNDLDLVTSLIPPEPLPAPGELAGTRARLIAAIHTTEDSERTSRRPVLQRWAGQPGPAVRPARWPGRRLVLTTAVAAAAAAAAVVAAALIAVPGHSRPPSVQPGAAPSSVAQPIGQPGSSQPASPQPPITGVAAVSFLKQAAAAVGQQPVQPPGPGQFVYTKIDGTGGAVITQMWLSADGSKGGLVRDAGTPDNALPPCTAAQAVASQGCAEVAGYLPGMPAQPQQLLAYLNQIGIAHQPHPGDDASWEANDFGKAVDTLMSTTYLLPAQQAALFELMAQFPGYTIVKNAADATGRLGVAIKWVYEGAAAEIILNPSTYAYMGDRTWPPPGSTLPGADAYAGGALVQMAFVSKAGQLP